MTKRPIVAFLYDFDKTLCTTDMEDYAFIPSLGYTPSEFWAKANGFGYENKMDGLLAYMYTMIRECAAQGIRLDRDYLVRSGEAIELFPGVREWFARITAYGADLGVDVEHYVISSGLREIIEGSGIAHEFKQIYACEFYYDESGLAAHEHSVLSRQRRGLLDAARDLHTLARRHRRAHHEVPPVWQRSAARQRKQRILSHHDGLSRRERTEMLEVGGNMKQQCVVPADGPVFVHTDDGGHSVLLYTAMGIFASNGQGS